MKNIFLSIAASALLSVSAASFAQSASADASAALDINTATVSELRAIGFTKAQASKINTLAQQDPFDSTAELKSEVKGVTNKTIAKLKGQVQIGTDLVGNVTGAVGGLLGGVGNVVGGVASGVGNVAVGATTSVKTSMGVMDINRASAQQLEGMGFSADVAAAIQANAAQDPIDSVKELQSEVPGVTNAMLAKLNGSLEIGNDLVSIVSSTTSSATNSMKGSVKVNGCVNNPSCQQ